jgi:signal transduction histidine kinase
VLLTVEDDGPGIALELRERIFEPFMSSKGEGGLGMGLYMARLIVESHHGRISVTDGAQGGARFQVTLPSKRV